MDMCMNSQKLGLCAGDACGKHTQVQSCVLHSRGQSDPALPASLLCFVQVNVFSAIAHSSSKSKHFDQNFSLCCILFA